jgi:hypothetical protein
MQFNSNAILEYLDIVFFFIKLKFKCQFLVYLKSMLQFSALISL